MFQSYVELVMGRHLSEAAVYLQLLRTILVFQASPIPLSGALQPLLETLRKLMFLLVKWLIEALWIGFKKFIGFLARLLFKWFTSL